MSRPQLAAAALAVASLFALAAPARATLVSWDIDSAASYVRLSILDQVLEIDSVTAQVRVRDQNNANWSDAGGRRAFLEGTVETDVTFPGGLPLSLNYVAGSDTVRAVDDKNLRPNPASWNGTTYTDTTTAPAAFGGKLRGTVLGQNFDAGFFAFRDLAFDIAGGGPLSSYSLPGGSATFGISDGTLAVDGVSSIIPVEILADQLTDAPPLGSANSGGTTLTPVIGFLWRLTYTVNQPVSIYITDDAYVDGTATGQIVAYAVLIPEPSSVIMAGVAGAGLCWAGRCRLHRRKANRG